jgi:hypothetical protein
MYLEPETTGAGGRSDSTASITLSWISNAREASSCEHPVN